MIRLIFTLFLLPYSLGFQSLPFASLRRSIASDSSRITQVSAADSYADFAIPFGLNTTLSAVRGSKKKSAKKTSPGSTGGRADSSSSVEFKRTNRIEGMAYFVKELELLKREHEQSQGQGKGPGKESESESGAAVGIGMITLLAKELLYSGIPEQVIEMYCGYYDMVYVIRRASVARMRHGCGYPLPLRE